MAVRKTTSATLHHADRSSIDYLQINPTSWSESFGAHDLYDLYDLYDLAHVVGVGAYNPHIIYFKHMFPGLDMCPTDPAQPLMVAG